MELSHSPKTNNIYKVPQHTHFIFVYRRRSLHRRHDAATLIEEAPCRRLRSVSARARNYGARRQGSASGKQVGLPTNKGSSPRRGFAAGAVPSGIESQARGQRRSRFPITEGASSRGGFLWCYLD